MFPIELRGLSSSVETNASDVSGDANVTKAQNGLSQVADGHSSSAPKTTEDKGLCATILAGFTCVLRAIRDFFIRIFCHTSDSSTSTPSVERQVPVTSAQVTKLSDEDSASILSRAVARVAEIHNIIRSLPIKNYRTMRRLQAEAQESMRPTILRLLQQGNIEFSSDASTDDLVRCLEGGNASERAQLMQEYRLAKSEHLLLLVQDHCRFNEAHPVSAASLPKTLNEIEDRLKGIGEEAVLHPSIQEEGVQDRNLRAEAQVDVLPAIEDLIRQNNPGYKSRVVQGEVHLEYVLQQILHPELIRAYRNSLIESSGNLANNKYQKKIEKIRALAWQQIQLLIEERYLVLKQYMAKR